MTSFSRLASDHEVRVDKPGHDDAPDEEQTQDENRLDRFGFARGAVAGNLLHSVLERIDLSMVDSRENQDILRDQLELFGFSPVWYGVLAKWLQEIVVTPLTPHASLRLDQLTAGSLVSEMSFHFPLQQLEPGRLNQVLAEFGHLPLPEKEQHIEGMMKGFIDLIFCFQDRYYIADYKSNHLGNTFALYSRDLMESAMVSHRYDLQYLIYTVALHRYLGQRLPGYSFTKHFGGVYYLFLRGMHPDHPGRGVHFARPEQECIFRLDDCFAGDNHA
jgi:exodeoxyribonuclease V beta subunit